MIWSDCHEFWRKLIKMHLCLKSYLLFCLSFYLIVLISSLCYWEAVIANMNKTAPRLGYSLFLEPFNFFWQSLTCGHTNSHNFTSDSKVSMKSNFSWNETFVWIRLRQGYISINLDLDDTSIQNWQSLTSTNTDQLSLWHHSALTLHFKFHYFKRGEEPLSMSRSNFLFEWTLHQCVEAVDFKVLQCRSLNICLSSLKMGMYLWHVYSNGKCLKI